MDADTTRTKDGYEEILSAFANGEADILVGTQMIVKGHDFPDVTLVGILAADLSLHVNDYRAGERTFQLLTQAAGRAGRGRKAGEVVIQTYDPEHYSIVYAAKQDYKGFYEEEILYREMLAYPPAAHMLAVLVTSLEEEEGKKLAEEIGGLVRGMAQSEAGGVCPGHGLSHPEAGGACPGHDGTGKRARESAEQGNCLHVIGPAPASVGKINDIYRFMLYIKHEKYGRLVEVKNELEEYWEGKEERKEIKKESIQFDFDPIRAY